MKVSERIFLFFVVVTIFMICALNAFLDYKARTGSGANRYHRMMRR